MAISLREYQEEACRGIQFVWRQGNKRALISMPTGVGKCTRPDALVWSGGLRHFVDLRDDGDTHILSPAGMRRIEGWHDDGVRKGLKLTTECGFEVDGTAEHRVWIRTRDGWEGWRRLSDMQGDEYVAVARGHADWGKWECSEAWAQLMGLIIADGYDLKKGEGVGLTKCERTVLGTMKVVGNWVDECHRANGRRVKGYMPILHPTSLGNAEWRATSVGLGAWMKNQLSLEMPHSCDRTVPINVMRGTRPTVAYFLQGYFAGDGEASAKSHSIEATTTSRELARQIQALLAGLGVWASFRPRKSVGKPAWRITIRDIPAFGLEVGFPSWAPRSKIEALRGLLASKRNTNTDVVPGVGDLIQGMGKTVRCKRKRQDAWRHADAYYSGARVQKMPSYETVRELVEGAEDCQEKRDVENILVDHYAWSPIRSIVPSTCHRIDCSVEGEHSYIGNGVVNHNTWVFVFMAYAVKENGLRTVILENTDELVRQTVEKLERVGVYPGVIQGTKNEWSKDVVVASIQTLSKASRLYNLPPNHFGFVVVDECHYANAPSYQRVLNYFKDAWHLGVTATPFRGDKKSLAGAGWDAVAYVYPLQQAISEGWLAPVTFKVVQTNVQLTGVGSSGATLTSEKDFNAKALEKLIDTPERNERIVEAALQHLVQRDGTYKTQFRRTIAFCAGVQHSVNLANAFRKRGVEAFAIYGSLKIKARRMLIKGHQKGLFPVICNCNILTTGYDDPHVSALIMARPTKSKVMYMQQLGRGLRIDGADPGKTCVVLDVVDVASKHNMAIGKELVDLEDALDERDKQAVSAGLVPSEAPA